MLKHILVNFSGPATMKSTLPNRKALTRYSALCPIFMGFALIFAHQVLAFPVEDAYDKHQADPKSPGFNMEHDVPPSLHRSLNPNLNDQINEPHPFPEYLKRFSPNGRLPTLYRELLLVPPVDQVQSKVFDHKAFQKVYRIGVQGFENKTAYPNKVENAGQIVALQASQELRNSNKYTVIPPAEMETEGIRLRITPGVSGIPSQPGQTPSDAGENLPGLPASSNRVDAVLIGAVTKYVDSYVDRHGKRQKSITSGVEFAAFLVSTETGKVIWGARYVGSQRPSVLNLFNKETMWLDKEELSRAAMKNVLRAFHERASLNIRQ